MVGTGRRVRMGIRNNKISRHIVLGISTFLLASCNSGGGNVQAPGLDFDGVESGPPLRLSGILAAGEGSATVCLDEDLNLRCDADEPAVAVEAGRNFDLTVPASDAADHGVLLAEFASGSAASRQVDYVLATPVQGERRIDILSTLVAANMREAGGSTPEAAWTRLERALRLPGHLTLQQMRMPAFAPQWPEVERVALAALHRATVDVRRLDGSLGAGAVTAALSRSLSRYIEPDSRGLLPTVGARTLASDIAGNLTEKGCPLPDVVRLDIQTEGGVPILLKDDKVPATVRIDGAADPAHNLLANAEISGRGNSTWGMPKKPYKIKFDTKTIVLGMPAAKSWAVLANYSDKTLLRNALAFCLSYKLGLEYSPHSRFAELTMNGEYLGLYQITNKTDEVEKAVEKAQLSHAGDAFVLEMDERRDGDFWFFSRFGIPYVVGMDSSPEQAADIERWVTGVEQTLIDMSASGDISGLQADFDVESFIDLYLINEFLRNNDGFWSSTYVYRLGAGQPLTFGPVWDFDIAAGNIDYNDNDSTEGWWTRNMSRYYPYLARDPNFSTHVAARWAYLSSQMPRLRQFIARSAAIDAAQQRNFARWPILDLYVWPNAVVTGSYAGEIDYLDQWLEKRAAWMDGELLVD